MSATHTSERHLFLSVPVDDLTYNETIVWIEQKILTRDPCQICTINPEFVIAAQNNPRFLSVLQEASLCLPDGQGLLWAAQLHGVPLRQRVAGSTLVDLLAKKASSKELSLFFLGAGPGVAKLAADNLRTKYPGLPTIHTMEASPSDADAPSIIQCIRDNNPDILFVAFGAPTQDLWINRHRKDLGAPVCIGVGGAFDFISGRTKRAPLIVQRLGFEWLHRLWTQPWRWKRMMALPLFAWKIITNRKSVTKINLYQ
ncbi:MAG TPA: WecB/TagA/CpsF family glycosyltransferase [Anaerolineales bacterium]|nr:WecB/TagA/CpsF family glycosyltransferase [Anaerolineales bacterium]|tara:strand:+ start:2935 stop:3702 length:768 start_codon:yes stop_codon:yes gene_type:complete